MQAVFSKNNSAIPTHLFLTFSTNFHFESTERKTMCNTQANIAHPCRNKRQVVSSQLHLQMQVPSNRCLDLAPREFVHTNAKLQNIYDNCKDARHGNSQLYCSVFRNLCIRHCRKMSYFPRSSP